jgi:hypothetical protein
MAIPLEIIGNIATFIADTEGLMADITGAISDVTGFISNAQGALLQYEYLMAIPIIAAEFQGLVDIIMGIGKFVWGFLQVIPPLANSLGDGMFSIFTFSYTWMMCLFKNIANIQACFFYYLLEIIGQILYLPIRIILWMVFKCGYDLYKYEKMGWDVIELIDDNVFYYADFHICHFPKSIREKCYNCKRLKVSALVQHSTPLINVLVNDVPNNMMPGFMRIIKGGEELMHPFGF